MHTDTRRVSRMDIFLTAAAILFAAAVVVRAAVDLAVAGRVAFTPSWFAATSVAVLAQGAVVVLLATHNRSHEDSSQRG